MLRYLLHALAATAVLAMTDQEGCTSFTSTVTVDPSPGYGNTYETVIWYVPDTLEICRGVDCGGGCASPRKVPGCPAYSGTDTITASFLATDPAARPTATPTTLAIRTLETTPIAKLTLVMPVSTGESAPTGQGSSASEGDSTTTATDLVIQAMTGHAKRAIENTILWDPKRNISGAEQYPVVPVDIDNGLCFVWNRS